MELNGTALVLGGGGVTGVAWEVGLLLGLLEAGVELSSAGLVIGTSAGSAVAAQLCSGTPLPALFERQLTASSSELPAKLGGLTLLRYAWALVSSRDPRRARVKLGHLALGTRTISEAQRREAIAARLPSLEWPARSMIVTTVNARTGEFRTLDSSSGVPLLDAVCASCAVPGVWPTVTIEGERYMDGGMRSAANVDLAEGRARVVVLAPIATGFGPMPSVAAQVDALRAAGSKVVVVSPDATAKKQLGRNALDPSKRADSARAGRAQAALVAREVAAVWNG